MGHCPRVAASRDDRGGVRVKAQRWQQVKTVLDQALSYSAVERASFLDRACQGDSELRLEVESLLSAHDGAGTGFLQEPAVDFSAQPGHVREGRIGPYEILGEIGRGGMGEVYRAVRADGQYRKEVAIKLVRSGFESSSLTERFRNERQILASLDHPNIARLLDGGSTESRTPYLVMELVEGIPIDRYCEAHDLSIRQRLLLFLKVCEAVQYAHQRLVIHRDLKPNNIIVANDGTPKLLDFGIAKLLDAPASATTLTPAMTPEYASPEQIQGERLTTASDLYSLGVVLYRILTGRSPYPSQAQTPHALARAICEDDPIKPSTVVRQLRGDLDNIVLMSLRKEPQRRYSSAEQLANDISRHLENMPVSASRGTARYRASKFIVRHKAGVAAAAAVTATLVIGLAVTLWQARIARVERELAEQRFKDMRDLARSNLFEFYDAIQNLPESAPARHLVIQRALGYLDKLSHDKAEDPSLMRELAAGYERIGSLQGNFSGPGIGDSTAALASYEKAFTIRDALSTASRGDVIDLKAECDLLNSYLRVLQVTGKTAEASRITHRGLDLAELLVQKRPNDREFIMNEARAYFNLGRAIAGSGSSASSRELPEAITYEREALKLLSKLEQENRDSEVLTQLMRSNLLLGYHLRKNHEFDAALQVYDSFWTATNGLRSLPLPVQFSFYNYRSRLFADMGDYRRAVDDDRKTLAVAQSQIQADRHDLIAQINAALAKGNLGLDDARLGDKVHGKAELDEALLVGEQLLAANPSELYYKSLLSLGYAYEAEILFLMDHQPEAQAKYSQALKMETELAASDPQDLEARLNIAKLHDALGVVTARMKRYSEAEQELQFALRNFDELLRIRPHDAEALFASAAARSNLSALQSCVADRECQALRVLQLPTLNN
jgi:eukaryotic-like serine/threonine-protein kinase